MQISDEDLKKITRFGILEYKIDKIINILEIENTKELEKEFNNKNSEVYKAYKKGLDKADFMIDSKLFDMALNGDLKALHKYEYRKKQRK